MTFAATIRVFWAFSASKIHLSSGLCPKPKGGTFSTLPP